MQWETAGGCAVSWEWESATVRATIRPPEGPGDLPPYTAAARVTRITADAVKVSGLCGDLTPRHFWLFAAHLRKMGVRWLYAERIGAHVVPRGAVVAHGAFAGWWQLDLNSLVDRRRGQR